LSLQREAKPAMTTGLERIAVKARSEPKLRFTSLDHHITKERVWESLNQIQGRKKTLTLQRAAELRIAER
jgi:RNA-directed DNA polymerase